MCIRDSRDTRLQEACPAGSSITVSAKFVAGGVVLGTSPIDGGEDGELVIDRRATPACDFIQRAKTAAAKPTDLVHLANVDAG